MTEIERLKKDLYSRLGIPSDRGLSNDEKLLFDDEIDDLMITAREQGNEEMLAVYKKIWEKK